MQMRKLFATTLFIGSTTLVGCGATTSSLSSADGGQGGRQEQSTSTARASGGSLAMDGAIGGSKPATLDGGIADSPAVGGTTASGGLAVGGTRITSTAGGRATGGASVGASAGRATGGASVGRSGGASLASGGRSGGNTVRPDAGLAGSAGADASPSGGTSAQPDAGIAVNDGGSHSSTCAPVVGRGGKYFTFAEKFNRYYTDCAWQPSKTVYVSPAGTGKGTSRGDAASVSSALASVQAGQMIVFTAGTYSGCYELDSDRSGTYDSPIVLTGERKADGSIGAVINCCASGRKSCFNLEAADYVAVEGFEMVGGDYGVRSVGAGYAANQHQRGVAVLRNVGHGQNKDPFFTGQSDWFVIESCTGYDPGSGDGHGIYLSNGSDWNIARWNETFNTVSSDFQINADPLSTCEDEGIAANSAECDAVAGTHTTGGRGASDYMLIDSNFFHHSQAQGANFTSVRNSTIKNNIFALPAKHGASFWQETSNPKLGSSNNLVMHNLFVTHVADQQAIGIINSSTGNQFKNNVVVAVSISGSTVAAHANGQLLATDSSTVAANTFEHNAWISGAFGSDDGAAAYVPNASEHRLTNFDAAWFTAFPTTMKRDASGFAPTASAPWLDKGNLLPEVPSDRTGADRKSPVDLGPYER